MPTSAAVAHNRLCGARFEKTLEHFARIEGMLVARQPLAFRYRTGGKAVAIRAELDYALVTPEGRVSWVDAKSCGQPTYARSALTPHQVRRAYVYNHHNVPAGFVVEFRSLNQVVFFTGLQAYSLSPGQSLHPSSGLSLGSCVRFSLYPLFQADLGARLGRPAGL